MKQLQGELDGVTNEINRTKVLLGNLVGGSSEFLFQLVKNNSQLRDLFNSAENQGLMINWNGNNNCQELVNHHNRNWWSSLVGGSTNNSDDELDDYDVSDYDYY